MKHRQEKISARLHQVEMQIAHYEYSIPTCRDLLDWEMNILKGLHQRKEQYEKMLRAC